MLRAFALEKGLPVDVFIYAICILYQISLSGIYHYIPKNPTAKHLYSFITSSLGLVLLYSFEAYLHFIAIATITYVLCLFRSLRVIPILVLIIALSHLSWVHMSVQHWYRDDLEFIDFSTPLMVFVLKITSFAWVLHDGTNTTSPLAVRDFPTPLEAFGFFFFFPGMWIGPACEFNDYMQFIHERPPFDKIPSTLFPGLRVLIFGILLFIANTVGTKYLPIVFCVSEEFMQWSFWKSFWFLFISGFIYRTRYHAAWKIGEAAAIFAGVGYNGKDKDGHTFDRLENTNVYKVEFGENAKALTTHWNKGTGAWLKNHVYERVSPGKPNGLSATITYFVSAFWHGFYPGYYLTFLSASLLTMASRSCRKNIRPLFQSNVYLKKFYDVLGWFTTMMIAHYFFVPFAVKEFHPAWTWWKNTYFIMHLLCIGAIVWFDYISKPKKKKKSE